MKLPLLHRQRGIAFTLVELLVVIGIIAILAAVVIGGVGSALRFAKRTKAASLATTIQTAVQSYYSEYGVYPTATVSPTTDDYYDGTTGGGQWGQLTIALCGNIDPYTGTTTTSTVPNTRSISYLSPTRSDLDATNHTLSNPFGSAATAPYFFMIVDTDYSGVAGDTGAGEAQLINFSSGTTNVVALGHGVPGGVAVWCSCDQPLLGAGGKSNPNFWAHTY